MKVKSILRAVARFARAKDAVSAMEYAIVVGIVVAGVGGAVWAFTGDVKTAIGTVGKNLGETAKTAPTVGLAKPT